MKEINQFQKSIIGRYLEIHQYPTLKRISQDTNIQITRVFRILNGSEMKLSEYCSFKKSLQQKFQWTDLEEDLQELTFQCLLNFSSAELRELMNYIERKLRREKLKKGLMIK